MIGAPPSEVTIHDDLVRALIAQQHPDLSHLRLERAGEGWDNVSYRLGDALAVRLPRRAMAAPLIVREQRWLPALAPLLPLPISAPVRVGAAALGYPFPWSIVPWFEGRTAAEAGIAPDQGAALARFFLALHKPASEDAPHNLYRGVPLAMRADAHDKTYAAVAALGGWIDAPLEAVWRAARAAPDETGAPVWLHGDPHPLNVLVDDRLRIAALIDWGDCCAGDRASDLAAIWMLFDAPQARGEAVALLAPDGALLARAKGWAMYYALTFIEAGAKGDPALTRIGARALANLRADS